MTGTLPGAIGVIEVLHQIKNTCSSSLYLGTFGFWPGQGTYFCTHGVRSLTFHIVPPSDFPYRRWQFLFLVCVHLHLAIRIS